MKIDRLTITHLTLLSALIFLLYSNSFNTAWHLDDGPNILHNHPILIKTISPESLWKSLFAKPFAEGTLYRPVANLTFALNYFIGNENPTGYHVTNLFIHICTAIFLYQSIILILNSTQVPLSTKTNRYRIAVISSLLWAINPIQTQAITYIVQRMASMAGMFFIGSIFLYLKAASSKFFDKQNSLSVFMFTVLSPCSRLQRECYNLSSQLSWRLNIFFSLHRTKNFQKFFSG